MQNSEKLSFSYLFEEKIFFKKNILDRLFQVDTLVFDIDGVLIDVRNSFMKAVCQTVQFYFKKVLHFSGSHNLINLKEVEYFKMAGGFNNDWDLTLAVVLFYLMKARKDNLIDVDELRDKKPDIKIFTTKVLPFGGGLSETLNLLEKENGRNKDWILNLWDKDLIIKIFKEIYTGEEYCFNINGFHPSLIKSEGLIKHERVIINENKKEFLQNFSVGVLTGRTKGEARIALKKLNWSDFISEENLITVDDCSEKPHPQGLIKLSENLKTRLGLYVGDIWDDLHTVKNFNKEIKKVNFLSAIVLAEKINLKNEATKFYLNKGVDLLSSDVNCILNRLEKAMNKSYR